MLTSPEPTVVAKRTDAFVEKANRLNFENYDNDVRLIKAWAAETREVLRRVDIERVDLSAKTLAVMKALAAGRSEDERIVGLALMARKAAGKSGSLTAQAALFDHLSGPAGFALAHEPAAAWAKLPADVLSAIADWEGKIFGDELAQDAVRDAVVSLKTEKIAGVVAYVASGRMEGELAHWEGAPARARSPRDIDLRDTIGVSCADALLQGSPTIVDGVRAITAEIKAGNPWSNDTIVEPDHPDRLVITPNDQGGAERLTMALASSAAGSANPYFGDYVEAVDALTDPGSDTPFAGVPLTLLCVNAGSFIVKGQASGAGAEISKALEGTALEEREDLAMLALLSSPLQWQSKKMFMDFFRFTPLVLGASTLRWLQFIEGLAASDQTDEQKRREALLWTIARFANGIKALDCATNQTSYIGGGIEQFVNSTLKKAALLLNALPILGGDVLTKKDYDGAVKPLAEQVADLVDKLKKNLAGPNVSVLIGVQRSALAHSKETGFQAFKDEHDAQDPTASYETTVALRVMQ